MAFSSEFIESTLDSGFHERWERKNVAYLDRPYTYLASFPRSGNGWVRLVIAVAALKYPLEDISKLELRYKEMGEGSLCSCLAIGDSECSIQNVFPDIYHFDNKQQNRAASTNSIQLPARLIKTHHVCKSAKAVFLFRSPSSCLTSAALYFDRKRVAGEPVLINDTVGYLAKYYQALMRHFIEQYDCLESQVLFVNHEDLRKDGTREFKRIFEFLGMRVPENSLAAILKRFPFKSSFDEGFQQLLDARTVNVLRSIEDTEYAAAWVRCQPLKQTSRAG